eukprot:TRINITY_DN698_c0_g1_i9.p2 TRINITY_DN698_c0_g1~~TRINITY_DN698_c0_g1_i9.p2  ORF type:complete len:100 (-),score=2.83 TRINITY_DN698_c0_g1_i9:110-409(-)
MRLRLISQQEKQYCLVFFQEFNHMYDMLMVDENVCVWLMYLAGRMFILFLAKACQCGKILCLCSNGFVYVIICEQLEQLNIRLNFRLILNKKQQLYMRK